MYGETAALVRGIKGIVHPKFITLYLLFTTMPMEVEVFE